MRTALNGSGIAQRLHALQLVANGAGVAMQRMDDPEEITQEKSIQRQAEDEEDDAPMALKKAGAGGVAPVQANPAEAGGLPADLKSGVESLSGMSMDGVRVHRNSPEPASVQAHAYAQGRDIHLAPGQDRHLPHEAWHVAQQAQGRVRPTIQAAGVAINDDAGLEREADVMGARALSAGQQATRGGADG